MKSIDKRLFLIEIGLLAESMDETLTEGRIEVYFKDLSDFPIEAVIKAIRAARKEFQWFPKIRHLRDLCKEALESLPKKRISDDYQLVEKIELSESERKASEERVKAIIAECRRKLGIKEADGD